MQYKDKLTCQECDFVTLKEVKLVKHIRKVHQMSAMKCPFCSLYTTSQSQLAMHKKREHHQVRLNCCLCEYNTRGLKKWIRHMTHHHAGQTQALSTLFLSGDDLVFENSAHRIQDKERDQKVCGDTATSKYGPNLKVEKSPEAEPKNEVDNEKSKTIQTNLQHINANMELYPATIKKSKTKQHDNANVEFGFASVKNKRKRDKKKTSSHDKSKIKKRKHQQLIETIDISSDENVTNTKDSGSTSVANIEHVNRGNLQNVKHAQNKLTNIETDTSQSVRNVDNKSNILFESESAIINNNNSHTELTIVSDVETDESLLDKMLSGTFHTTLSSGELCKPTELNAVAESLVGKQESSSTEIVDIPCPYCENTFSSYRLILEHCRDTHHYTTPYRCPKCSYSNDHLSILVTHMRKHTGEKPFSCHLCAAKFSQKGNLIQHIKTHSQEKQYACHFCSYRCHAKGYLVIHLRFHTNDRPYKCSMCDFAAFTSSRLKLHIRKHTGEKPYECENCKTRFSDLSGLIKHKRTAVCI